MDAFIQAIIESTTENIAESLLPVIKKYVEIFGFTNNKAAQAVLVEMAGECAKITLGYASVLAQETIEHEVWKIRDEV